MDNIFEYVFKPLNMGDKYSNKNYKRTRYRLQHTYGAPDDEIDEFNYYKSRERMIHNAQQISRMLKGRLGEEEIEFRIKKRYRNPEELLYSIDGSYGKHGDRSVILRTKGNDVYFDDELEWCVRCEKCGDFFELHTPEISELKTSNYLLPAYRYDRNAGGLVYDFETLYQPGIRLCAECACRYVEDEIYRRINKASRMTQYINIDRVYESINDLLSENPDFVLDWLFNVEGFRSEGYALMVDGEPTGIENIVMYSSFDLPHLKEARELIIELTNKESIIGDLDVPLEVDNYHDYFEQDLFEMDEQGKVHFKEKNQFYLIS